MLFRSGWPPATLNGRYAGRLVRVQLFPGVTQLVRAICWVWMPWQGKAFDSNTRIGFNIFAKNSLLATRILWPFYRGIRTDAEQTYVAFAFRTWTGSGKLDPDVQVLKIDYDLPGNPKRTIARVLDELVQLPDGTLLGKAQLHWWWGRWQTVAYFTLKRE